MLKRKRKHIVSLDSESDSSDENDLDYESYCQVSVDFLAESIYYNSENRKLENIKKI